MFRTQILDKLNDFGVPVNISGMLLKIGEFEDVKTKSVLIDIGGHCQNIYFILKGEFVSQYLTKEGEYSTVNFYLHNFQQFVTIPNSYFLNETSNFRIKSITKSTVLALSKERLDKLVNESSEFSQWYHAMIISALVEEYKAKSNLIALVSKDKYKHLIKYKPEIIQQVPSIYIAQYLGISREHLSRIRKEIDD